MADVHETRLPGTGVRHDFATAGGRRVGVLLHRTGQRDLLVYDPADPDRCLVTVSLSADDAATLVELLGGSQVSEAVGAALRQRIRGLAIDWIEVSDASEYAGRSIGEAGLRTRTGASVVAVIHGDDTVPSPEPDFVLRPGDTVVAVGTDDGVRALASLLRP